MSPMSFVVVEILVIHISRTTVPRVKSKKDPDAERYTMACNLRDG